MTGLGERLHSGCIITLRDERQTKRRVVVVILRRLDGQMHQARTTLAV
jgi:hypothetical protein